MSDVPVSPGTALAAARIRRGLSLDEIARATRIQRHVLDAVEADDFAALPAMVYVRGFIRLYAQALQLDPEAMVQLLDARLAERTAAEEAAQSDAEARLRSERWMRTRVRLTYAVAVLFLAVVAAAALFSLSPQPLEARHLRTGAEAADAAPVASPTPPLAIE
jgi:cytoskeleton protein RodZ